MKNKITIMYPGEGFQSVNFWDKIEIQSEGKTIEGLFLGMFPIEQNKEGFKILKEDLGVYEYLINPESEKNFIINLGVEDYRDPFTKKEIERAQLYQQKLEQAYGKIR